MQKSTCYHSDQVYLRKYCNPIYTALHVTKVKNEVKQGHRFGFKIL